MMIAIGHLLTSWALFEGAWHQVMAEVTELGKFSHWSFLSLRPSRLNQFFDGSLECDVLECLNVVQLCDSRSVCVPDSPSGTHLFPKKHGLVISQ